MLGAITHNLGWKLLALGVSLLLWISLVRDPELATTSAVPVLYRGMPRTLELSGDLTDRVELEVRGGSSRLTPEALTRAAVILDVGSTKTPGDRTFTIEASNVSVPSGVHFVRAVPSQLRLHFERRISRQVPVRIRIAEPPPDGYRLVSQVAEPETLAIVGPQSNVEQVSFVDTDSIDLSAAFEDSEFTVSTFVADPQVRFQGIPKVVVKVVIERTDTENQSR